MAGGPLIELDSTTPGAVDGRHIRAVTFQSTRLEYLTGVLERLGRTPSGSALVVGSGRGLLAEGLARLGYDVTGVDPSGTATRMARESAARAGLPVRYDTAPADRLGLDDQAFDLVYVADTFEVTADLDRVAAEASRVLGPGGLLVYDTVNRSPLARVIYLGAFQSLPFTRIMPPGRYAAARLRPPAEVAAALERAGLRNEDTCDFKPKNPLRLVKAVLARRSGRITDEEIAPIVDMVLVPDGRPLVTYLGYARKA
ncbi:methyltransferase domain-containing protein [Streptomyces sp. B1866]|uniref:class I SAM-dependent methyltransferase n=1 Tax=Streptomyces sp. B1866 TaxID=3075431 RepID=UPI00288E8B07|nr:methyltransferase domain-containing protein [Streptomyces sp. B1866]MDT3398244.1 methyltransferase domain-containing protein [Streptomyces sp. B1866]